MLAKGDERRSIEEEVARRNELVSCQKENADKYILEYESELKIIERDDRKRLWGFLGRTMWKSNPIFWPQVLLNLKQPHP